MRARLIISGLLGAAAFAAVVNEVVRWSSAAAVVFLGWKVPILGFLGLLILAVLVPPTLRRWSPAAAAARADSRLGLRDRLASWVDFCGRPEIPEPIRLAQARETARALAGATPASVAPISAWRKAAPVLLAVCLLYQYIIPARMSGFSPLMRAIVPDWRLAPTGEGAPAGESAVPPAGTEPRPDEKATPGRTAAKGGTVHGQDAAGNEQPGNQREGAGVDAETKLPNGDSRRTGSRTPADRGDGPVDPVQPERIESERVGDRLAQVVDPLYRAGSGQAGAALPAGVATFHLLPQAGSAGAGAGAGAGAEAVAPEPVRIDLDAVLAPYRPIVKAYFDQLARAPAPAGGAPPNAEPARSRP